MLVSFVYVAACRLFALVLLLARSDRSKELELLVLRHELVGFINSNPLQIRRIGRPDGFSNAKRSLPLGKVASDCSGIEWTEASWNPVTGCSKVSPGCAHCYAETLSLRFRWSRKPWLPEHEAENVVLHRERLDQPRRWRRARVIFVNSMSDLFHERVPLSYVEDVFGVMAEKSRDTCQILTKRAERLAELAPFLPWPPNVWIGVFGREHALGCQSGLPAHHPGRSEAHLRRASTRSAGHARPRRD